MELLHLRTPGGQVIGFSLPLHDTIQKQWVSGDLVRVNEDGSAWDEESDGEPFEDGGEDDEDGAESPAAAGEEPQRPGPRAHQRTWARYAVTLGVVSEADAEGMDRAELMRLATPPELTPEG